MRFNCTGEELLDELHLVIFEILLVDDGGDENREKERSGVKLNEVDKEVDKSFDGLMRTLNYFRKECFQKCFENILICNLVHSIIDV